MLLGSNMVSQQLGLNLRVHLLHMAMKSGGGGGGGGEIVYEEVGN